jgi:transposase
MCRSNSNSAKPSNLTDWSDEWLTVGGIHRKIQAAHTKLCASRAFFLSGYPTQAQEMLYEAHTRAFTALGGVPKRGIYDNMKTAVDKVVRRTNGRVVNSRFYAMAAHYSGSRSGSIRAHPNKPQTASRSPYRMRTATAIFVRAGFLQCGVGLGKRHCREERAGFQAQGLDRSQNPVL